MFPIRNVFALALTGMLCLAADASAQMRHSPFFPGFRPRPPVPTTTPPGTTTPGTTPQNPRFPGIIFLNQLHRQQLLTQMMIAQDQALMMQMSMNSRNPYSSPMVIAYPYPSYSTPAPMANNANLPAAVNNANAAGGLGLLAGIVDGQGQVAWPLGLQILSPPLETKEMRKQLESALQGAASQAGQGRVQASVVDDASKVVTRLRQLLRQQREGMAEATVRDAEAFLSRMDEALKGMRY
jgi:hypothetical protein